MIPLKNLSAICHKEYYRKTKRTTITREFSSIIQIYNSRSHEFDAWSIMNLWNKYQFNFLFYSNIYFYIRLARNKGNSSRGGGGNKCLIFVLRNIWKDDFYYRTLGWSQFCSIISSDILSNILTFIYHITNWYFREFRLNISHID